MPEVNFPTWSPFTLADMRDPKVRARRVDGRGFLHVPANASGPLPAVVVMEGLGGLKGPRECAYGPKLAAEGFVALVVDSFGPRGVAKMPDNLRALKVTEAMMLADAFAALRFLAEHPAVDAGAVSVMGFSYGGMISVLCAYEQIRRTFVDDDLRFSSHVSYYGSSVPRLDDPTATGAPVLMFLGELDGNVSMERSRQIAADLTGGGARVELRVFPGVYHQWNGGDAERRFVRFGIGECCMRVDRDGNIRDERTGLRVHGPVTRSLAIVSGVSAKGFYIQKNNAVTAESDAAAYAFMRDAARQPTREPQPRHAAGRR